MDYLREAGLAARYRVAPTPAAAADVRGWSSSWPQRPGAGDRRGALPPRPPPSRRGGGGGGGAARDAGEAADGARDARRVAVGVGGGAGKAEDDAGGGSGGGAGTARSSGVVARTGPNAESEAGGNAGAADVPGGGDGGAGRVLAVAVAKPEGGSGGGEAGSKKRAFASLAAPLEEGSGGGEVGSDKRPFASSAAVAPRAFPPPKRRLVSAVRRFPPGCGRGVDGAGDFWRLVTTTPALPSGGSAASPTKPAAAAAVAAAARHPPSVDDAGSGGVLEKASAAVDGPRLVVAPARHSGASPTKHAAAADRHPPSVGKAGSGGVLEKPSAADDCSRVIAVPTRPGCASLTKPAAAADRHPPSAGKAGSGGVLEKPSAAVDGSRVVAVPAHPGCASPKKPAAAAAAVRHPPSIAEAGSSGMLKKVSAEVDGSQLVVAPERHGGGCAASPTKPSAASHRSVGEAGSSGVLKVSAALVPRPVADGGRHDPHAAALKSLEPSRRSGIAAAADGLLDTDSQGCSGTGGFGSGKEVVRFLPKPGMMSAIRRFPPGCGRVKVLQPLNRSAEKCPETESKDSSTSSDSFGPNNEVSVKGSDHVRLKVASACTMGSIRKVEDLVRFPPGCGRVKVLQPLNKSAEKCPETESKDSSTSSESFGPNNKVSVKRPGHVRLKVASACTMGSISKVEDLVDSILADDAFLKAEYAYQRKLQLKLNGSSDARSKFKMICGRFQFICKAIVQFVEQRSLKISRIDIAASKVIKKLRGFTQLGPVIGDVPGVEVGDEFVYRVELALVGLHRPLQPGIDSMKDENGVLVAISIVASGGYPDELSSPGELIYTGFGGKYAGKKSDENQKLEGGNLALKNCIQTMTPVRVIHGFKGREEGSHSRAKGATAFTYDGLYHVVDYWREGQAGSKVFKYKLLRIPGQPELSHRRKTGIMC